MVHKLMTGSSPASLRKKKDHETAGLASDIENQK